MDKDPRLVNEVDVISRKTKGFLEKHKNADNFVMTLDKKIVVGVLYDHFGSPIKSVYFNV